MVCSHVDDLIIGGERGHAAWLMEELEKKFTLSGGVLIPISDQNAMEPVRFLKKRNFFIAQGVVISPHEKYISELIKLHGLEQRKPKPTPDISYDNLDGPELSDMDKHLFRSSMGTPLPVTGQGGHTTCRAKCQRSWHSRG